MMIKKLKMILKIQLKITYKIHKIRFLILYKIPKIVQQIYQNHYPKKLTQFIKRV